MRTIVLREVLFEIAKRSNGALTLSKVESAATRAWQSMSCIASRKRFRRS
jgi:hypothetical protein